MEGFSNGFFRGRIDLSPRQPDFCGDRIPGKGPHFCQVADGLTRASQNKRNGMRLTDHKPKGKEDVLTVVTTGFFT